MERYKVSGDDLRVHYSGGAILQDVFRDIERELKTERRVVCQYIVNGLAVHEKEESRFGTFCLSQIDSLEYLSESTDVLLTDVIKAWINAIPELQSGGEAMAARVRQGATQGVIKALYDLVENCELLVSSISSARNLIGDDPADGFGGFEALEKMTQQTFAEALRNLEKQDFVQLALVIEYDLNHGLQEWLDLLVGVQRGLNERGAKQSGNTDDGSSDPVAGGRSAV